MNSNVSNPPAQQINAGRAGVTQADILKGLTPAEDPLAFIQQNLGTAPVVQPTQAPVLPVQPTIPSFEIKTEQSPGTANGTDNTSNQQHNVTQHLLVDNTAEPESNTEESQDVAEDSEHNKEVSLRKMGKKIKAQEVALEEEKRKREELEQLLQKYEKGDELPTPAKHRISELEKYENLHALKTSPQYTEKYLKPIAETREKLKALAKDYELPDRVLEDAATIQSKRELNSYLRDYFDDLGAIEARDLIHELREKQLQAKQAEDSPKETFQRIQTEIEENQKLEQARRTNKIVESSQSGWIEALVSLQADERYPELVIKDNDPSHNQYSKPIVENAATEYGKFVKYLAQSGIKDLPKDIAQILAKRFALSEAALVMAQSRQTHYNEAQKLLENTRRESRYARPPVGGPMVNGPSKSQASPQASNGNALYNAADELLSKVGIR